MSMTEALEITRWLEDGQPEEVVWSKDVKSAAELSQLFDSFWERRSPPTSGSLSSRSTGGPPSSR